ncbi:hypothetical protein GJ744_010330 [Endocarpon pusillum]|uniref:Kinesin light chain n=1 Tax=Endocarpon pusillum TaxID=364733 RepID=A0A8H7AG98_9EURO|nr:hypothetical protein GJ744_010330 [Endocarpon pusillum]
MFKTTLGEKHPKTLMTIHNLAGVLQDQQRYKEAEEMRNDYKSDQQARRHRLLLRMK